MISLRYVDHRIECSVDGVEWKELGPAEVGLDMDRIRRVLDVVAGKFPGRVVGQVDLEEVIEQKATVYTGDEKVDVVVKKKAVKKKAKKSGKR